MIEMLWIDGLMDRWVDGSMLLTLMSPVDVLCTQIDRDGHVCLFVCLHFMALY